MNLKILVIEDDPTLRDAYHAVLQRHGFDPVFSLDMIQIKTIMKGVDIILSDYNMGLNFEEIADCAKSIGVPLLAVTGETRVVHPNQLAKPYSIDHLLKKIREVIGELNPYDGNKKVCVLLKKAS